MSCTVTKIRHIHTWSERIITTSIIAFATWNFYEIEIFYTFLNILFYKSHQGCCCFDLNRVSVTRWEKRLGSFCLVIFHGTALMKKESSCKREKRMLFCSPLREQTAFDFSSDWVVKSFALLNSDEYFRMKLQWKSVSEEQERRNSRLRDYRSLIGIELHIKFFFFSCFKNISPLSWWCFICGCWIFLEKDVNRTDRNNKFYEGLDNPGLILLHDILMTYCMYDFDLGKWLRMFSFKAAFLEIH